MLKRVLARCAPLLQRISQRSCAQHTDDCGIKPVLINTSALAQTFEQVSAEELPTLLEVYNQILPTIYKKKHLLDTVSDESLYELFDAGYLQREVIIDMIMHQPKESSVVAAEPRQPAPSKGGLTYTIILWIRPRQMDEFWRMRAVHTLMYGQPLVIDCAYEHLMKARREQPSYIRQLYHCITQNAKSNRPFNLTFCNMTDSSVLHKHPPPRTSWNPLWVNETSKCFTELYNKEDIIMLSPDAPLYLEKYDASKIYVIGGLVDLADAAPVSYEKAQNLGVECRKLPIDIWIDWKLSKRLALPAVVNIISTLAETGNWRTAFERSLAPRQIKTGNVCRLYTGRAGD